GSQNDMATIRLSEELMSATKDALKEAGKNFKMDVNLSGTQAAVFLSVLSLCMAGVASYGLYVWHDLQKNVAVEN
ncbi:hypothetical protein, partial [Pseudobutyrivibrio sp.]